MEEISVSLAGVPAILAFQNSPEEARENGTILFSHGLCASKDHQKKEILSLAQSGYLAVGIDNIGHGERRFGDFDERFSSQNPNMEANFLDAVKNTAEEIPQVIDALFAMKLAKYQVGMAGISMGGFITYASILADRRIKTAVSIVGSPKWKLPHPQSPHLYLDKFYPVALLSQNAEKDESVPPDNIRNFHQRLEPFYRQDPEKLCYIEYPGVGHFMPENDWNQLWDKTLGWFDKFLYRQIEK